MEADFNFFNGLLFAKRMMHQAEAQGKIPIECYGTERTMKRSRWLSTKGSLWTSYVRSVPRVPSHLWMPILATTELSGWHPHNINAA